jgi:hypothetical protein
VSARCYTVAQLLGVELLNMPRRTFFTLKKAGKLPFLEELKPRIGRRLRYRAEPVDRWLAGQWGQPRSFASHRRLAG